MAGDQTFGQWQMPSANYPAGDAPFRLAEQGGPAPVFHDQMDAMRSMYRRTPDAMYPDGYIGTIESRRLDRLRKSGNVRQDNRPYNRGVHKGERLEGRDYFWPDAFQPFDGLIAQAEGRKYVSPGLLMDAGQMGPEAMNQDPPIPLSQIGPRGVPARTGTVQWEQPENPDVVAKLKSLAPPWSYGPGMGVGTAYPGR